MHSGVINLDKPAGISSAGAVGQVKRLLPRKTRIGHAGTLDPFATGVLLLLIGSATKQCEQLMDQPKQYQATIKFGATTATDDPESPEIPWRDDSHGDLAREPPGGSDEPPEWAAGVTRERIERILPRFIGEIEQRPPAFSALKVGGRRAYDLARRGQVVTLQPRIVRVYGIELLDYTWPLLRLRIDCGRGTYIRALARDLGAALDVGGHLRQLQRTRIGAFSIEQAIPLEQLKQDGVALHLVGAA